MEKFNGTKGKWIVKHSESKDAFNIVGTVLGGKYKIARVPYVKDQTLPEEWNEREKLEAEANSKLISSAPEMLETLNKCATYLVGINDGLRSYIEELIKKAT